MIFIHNFCACSLKASQSNQNLLISSTNGSLHVSIAALYRLNAIPSFGIREYLVANVRR